MTIKIDKNAPIPSQRGSRTGITEALAKLEVGESFFLPGAAIHQMAGYAYRWHSGGRKFSCRTLTEDGVKGVRVWRMQ